jgi:hypothetical protein
MILGNWEEGIPYFWSSRNLVALKSVNFIEYHSPKSSHIPATKRGVRKIHPKFILEKIVHFFKISISHYFAN